jgi:hypothetical protein
MDLADSRTPWMVDSSFAKPVSPKDSTNTEETRTDIHASIGIRTHESSASACEDISYLRLRSTVISIYIHEKEHVWKLTQYSS